MRSWHLVVSIEALSALWSTADTEDGALDFWALRALPDYRVAALATVAYAHRAGPDALSRLRLADISPDGDWVQHGSERIPVPQAGRTILRAQRLSRRFQGAGEGDAYIESDNAKENLAPITRRAARRALGNLSVACGVPLTSHHDVAADAVAKSWLVRRHIIIRELSQAG